ncbi:MAG: hypothetical protein PVF73_00890 [Bacteroidales bacterium]|jgi:hypothetical protein
MNEQEIKRLKYRRQYIIGPDDIKCPFENVRININDKYICYSHADLVTTEYSEGNKKIILLGDMYDYNNTNMMNIEIIRDLFIHDFNECLEKISEFAGRYVLIYCIGDDIKIMHDASACRKIFYAEKNGFILCASTQHLLAKVANFRRTSNPDLLAYYNSSEFIDNLKSNIGDYTIYDEIRQVLPNHFLIVEPLKIVRYWPNQNLNALSPDECVEQSVLMIKGYIEAAAKRYGLMIPVTSGYDSRILLSATKNIAYKIFYYLNFSDHVKKTGEYKIPQKILSRHNIEFNLLDYDQQVDKDFEKIYYENNPLANEDFLSIIYNYYLRYSDKLNLPAGTIPIIKGLYHSKSKEINSQLLSQLYNVEKFNIARQFYKDWLNEAMEISDRFGINVFDLLYWEDRTCNWGTQVQLDKDIAQDEFVPFNSRKLIVTMLAYDEKRRKKPYFELNKEIIRKLWPELLKYPFNPSFKHFIKEILIYLKLYEIVMKLQGRLKYRTS